MHMQIRCHPVASPPDVDLLLSRLAERGVNLVAVGGSDVEFGGELALVPEDGQESLAIEVLEEFGYPHRELYKDDPDSGLRLCMASHESGGLHRCLEEASISNRDKGWKIRRIKEDGGCYEVYAMNEKGERVEAYFHPRTLAPVPRGAKDHKG